MPRIGPWQKQLEEMLASNAAKPARERLTLIRVFEELRGLGYEGGYDAVRRFAASWSQSRAAVSAAAFVPSRGTRASGATLRSGRGVPVRLRGKEDQGIVRGTITPTHNTR